MCRIVIGIVLIAAALAKLSDLKAFAREIENFDILYPGLENLPALLLPWVELIAGLGLVFGIRARSSAWIALGLMTVFTIAVIQALARGLDISCGCFGTAKVMKVGARKLIENLVFMGVSFVAAQRLWAPAPAAETTGAPVRTETPSATQDPRGAYVASGTER
jgi:uncharacterized membrane protein YphA (DoxX/SURF4 family)